MLKSVLIGATFGLIAASSAFATPSVAPSPSATIVAKPYVEEVYYYRGGYYPYRWGGGYYRYRRWYGGRWRYW
jgi:hypothetical protein